MYYDWTTDTLAYTYIFPWYSGAKTSYLYKKMMMMMMMMTAVTMKVKRKKIANDDIISWSARQTCSSSLIKFLSLSLTKCTYLFALSIYISSLIIIFTRTKEFFNPELGHHAYCSTHTHTYTCWSILQKIARGICFQLIEYKARVRLHFLITLSPRYYCSIVRLPNQHRQRWKMNARYAKKNWFIDLWSSNNTYPQ